MSGSTQVKNHDMHELLTSEFQSTEDPGYAWSRAVSALLLLPQIRGVWSMASVDNLGASYDASGQGRTLTNISSLEYGVYNGLVPYAIHNGIGDYLERPDEAGLDITTALTMGGWVWVDSGGGFSRRSVIGKWNTLGNQRSYNLFVTSGSGLVEFFICTDGTAGGEISFTSGSTLAVRDGWNFLVARYTPLLAMDMFINGERVTLTTGIPATIFNSTAAFAIGGLTGFLGGRTSLMFLSATALSNAAIQLYYQITRRVFSRTT